MNAPALPNAADRPPVVFRLAPDYRRIGIYLVVGWVVMVGCIAVLEAYDLLPHDDPRWPNGGMWYIGFVAAFSAIFMLVPAVLIYRYRLRIDRDGIWRRRFIRWDLWPWAAFANGRVHQVPSGHPVFVFPHKPWWFRRLDTSLTDADRDALAGPIQAMLPPLPPPELPETITIRYGFTKRLELSRTGLRLRRNRRDDGQLYDWSQVKKVKLTRADHAYRDFLQLEIVLPGLSKPIRLSKRGSNYNWRGPNSEVIAHYMEQNLPPERIEVSATSGLPRTVAEADRRLAELDGRERDHRRMERVLIPIMLAAMTVGFVPFILIPCIDAIWNGDWTGWIPISVAVLLFGPMLLGWWFGGIEGQASYQRERDELVRWRSAATSEDTRSHRGTADAPVP